MLKDRPNKIPMPRTIARHYSEGKYCDYPTDILLDAVNTADLPYNPLFSSCVTQIASYPLRDQPI